MGIKDISLPVLLILVLTLLLHAHHRKAQKPEYLQLNAELDHLGFSCEYHTVEIGCLGHFLMESISAMKAIMYKPYSCCRRVLDKAAAI